MRGGVGKKPSLQRNGQDPCPKAAAQGKSLDCEVGMFPGKQVTQ